MREFLPLLAVIHCNSVRPPHLNYATQQINPLYPSTAIIEALMALRKGINALT